jgi:hypothetical protein
LSDIQETEIMASCMRLALSRPVNKYVFSMKTLKQFIAFAVSPPVVRGIKGSRELTIRLLSDTTSNIPKSERNNYVSVIHV